jgi:hypothetical protein
VAEHGQTLAALPGGRAKAGSGTPPQPDSGTPAQPNGGTRHSGNAPSDRRCGGSCTGVVLVALAAGVFGLLARLGGLTGAADLRNGPAFVAAAIAAQAVSLACCALLYRPVLASLGARLAFRLRADGPTLKA